MAAIGSSIVATIIISAAFTAISALVPPLAARSSHLLSKTRPLFAYSSSYYSSVSSSIASASSSAPSTSPASSSSSFFRRHSKAARLIHLATALTSVSSTSSPSASMPSRASWRHFNPTLPSGSLSADPYNHTLSPLSCRLWSKEAYVDSCKFYDDIMACNDTYISSNIKQALEDLNGAYRLYGPEHVVGSYNGGKDAVVIMHLQRAAHAAYYRDLNTPNVKPIAPRMVYFDNPQEFPEISTLLDETIGQFDLDMMCLDGVSFSAGLSLIIHAGYSSPPSSDSAFESETIKSPSSLVNKQKHSMAFILGTRVGDPNVGNQQTFAPSSSWMPPFMRVNPVLTWSYGHVWHFLRVFDLPYCTLYDEGFTSLGKVGDTVRTPSLKKDERGYYQAFMLADWKEERGGRINKNALGEIVPNVCEVKDGMESGEVKVIVNADAGRVIEVLKANGKFANAVSQYEFDKVGKSVVKIQGTGEDVARLYEQLEVELKKQGIQAIRAEV